MNIEPKLRKQLLKTIGEHEDAISAIIARRLREIEGLQVGELDEKMLLKYARSHRYVNGKMIDGRQVLPPSTTVLFWKGQAVLLSVIYQVVKDNKITVHSTVLYTDPKP